MSDSGKKNQLMAKDRSQDPNISNFQVHQVTVPGYPTVGAIRITWKSIDPDFGCWALMVPPILDVSRPRENRLALIQVLKTVDTISE